MPSLLEEHARNVAIDVTGEAPTLADGERGVGFIEIITVVMTIFQTLIQSCPLPTKQKAAGLKAPSFRQRSGLMKCCLQTTGAFRVGKASEIYNSMLRRGSLLTDVDAVALVEEASDDGNLLI